MTVEQETIISCCECQQPIRPDQGFVCFKVPGGQTYRFFHCRSRVGDCWDRTSRDPQETLTSLFQRHSGTGPQTDLLES